MKPVVIRPSADADLDKIFAWIAHDIADAAERVVRRIVDAISRLADFPDSGASRPELGQEARSMVVGRYLVLYRVEPDRVEVRRIVHGARDLTGLFDQGGGSADETGA